MNRILKMKRRKIARLGNLPGCQGLFPFVDILRFKKEDMEYLRKRKEAAKSLNRRSNVQ